MYRIEKIGENILYVKVLGALSPEGAETFVKDFEEKTKDLEEFSVIADGMDMILLQIKTFEILLELLKRNNEKLIKAAYVVINNPALDVETRIMLERAESPNRKVVDNLDDAKKWLGISEIVIKRD
jgi:hypothetical protein